MSERVLEVEEKSPVVAAQVVNSVTQYRRLMLEGVFREDGRRRLLCYYYYYEVLYSYYS